MAYAKELMGAGFPAGQAVGVGGGYAAIVATGSTQANGTVVNAGANMCTAADGTKGVTLYAGMPGDEVWIFNNSGSTLKVYPPVGSAITVAGTGVGSANAAFSQLTYKATVYKFLTSTQIMAITSA